MTTLKSSRAAILAALGGTLCSTPLLADVWVFSPSVSLDQRFDDNFFLLTDGGDTFSATRAVGEIGVSRESQAFSIKGLAQVDAFFINSSDVGDDELDSNQIVTLDVRRITARSRYGFLADFTQDNPSRDAGADISEDSSQATDTGLDNLTQSLSNNVDRRTFNIEPSFRYDLTRRLELDTGVFYTQVEHDLPDAQDAIFQRYLDTFPRNDDGSLDGELLPFDEVTIDTPGVGVFTPTGELDDFTDVGFDVGLRYKLSPITTLTSTLDFNVFTAQVEPDAAAIIPFEDLIPDPDEPGIRREPRRESISRTTTLRVGFERFLTRNLQISATAGAFNVNTDDSDTLRPEDVPEDQRDTLDDGKDSTNGFLADIGIDYDADRTQYSVAFSVDVEPSSTGSQVESNELTGQIVHTLSPRLVASFFARAFEPDRLGTLEEDSFARRFISFEPRIQYNYSRTVTLTAAYRYRRQRARSEPQSAESNALLFAVKYTPASKVGDAAAASGL